MANPSKINSSRVLAGCVVRDGQGNYLMVREGNKNFRGLWSVPIGHVNTGEALDAAAMRETTEETGYRVKVGNPISLEHHTTPEYIVHIFTATIVGGQLAIEPELMDVAWKSYDELVELNGSDKIRAAWVWDSIEQMERANNSEGITI